ncbi:hypothetical protein ACFSW8_07555 [Rubritalea tangerina]|uniref:Uncharacterized protein n=2 Tax=Rubritalea tangerina TaxID=430798 RepID=A0ABW4ZA52_9BACT
MKTLFYPVFVFALAAFFAPQALEARSCSSHSSYTYVSGYTSCGCPIYTKRVVRYYDCHGHPVYGYYRQPVTHRCKRSHGHHHHARQVRDCKTYRYNHASLKSYKPRYSSSCGSRSSYRYSYVRR